MKRKPKPEPFRPTDDQIRQVLLITDVRWLSLDGIQKEYLRGIGARELRRIGRQICTTIKGVKRMPASAPVCTYFSPMRRVCPKCHAESSTTGYCGTCNQPMILV